MRDLVVNTVAIVAVLYAVTVGTFGETENDRTTPSVLYALSQYYDDSFPFLYGDNDSITSGAGCTTFPTCSNNSLAYAIELPVVAQRCDTYANCFEVSEFPTSLPADIDLLFIQNSFFKNITFEDMKNFTELFEISIEYNDLESIEPGTFRMQRQLKTLLIQWNSLTDLLPDTFAGLSSVKTLELQSNGIERLHRRCFAGLDSATHVNLNLNRISSLGPYAFSGLLIIESLDLQQNNISVISPLAFRGLLNLKILNLKLNHISSIPTRSLKSLPKLSSLYLGKNPITEIKRGDFKWLRSLRHLWLEDCEIRSIARRAFHDKNLYTLVLERNLLTNFPNLGRMKELLVLKLDRNPWKCDSKAIPMLRWLLVYDIVDVSVICYTPIYRRGKNLLMYSIENLIHGTGVRNPDITTTHSPLTTVRQIKIEVTDRTALLPLATEFREVTSTEAFVVSPVATSSTRTYPISPTGGAHNVTGSFIMTTQSQTMTENATLVADDDLSGDDGITMTARDTTVQNTEAHETVGGGEVPSTTDRVAMSTDEVDTRPRKTNLSIVIIAIVVMMLVAVCLVTAIACKVRARRRIEMRQRYLVRANATTPAASRSNGIRMHGHRNGDRPRPDLSKKEMTSLRNDVIDDAVAQDELKITVDANGNSPAP